MKMWRSILLQEDLMRGNVTFEIGSSSNAVHHTKPMDEVVVIED